MNRSRENLPVTISADWHSPIISATIYLRAERRGSIIADVIRHRLIVKTELIPFELEPNGPTFLRCWNIAKIKADQNTLHAILGTPHYIESDPRATAGGIENHWTFLSSDELPAFFRLRVPYEQVDFCLSRATISENEKSWLCSLFEGIEIGFYDEPWDETRHPNGA